MIINDNNNNNLIFRMHADVNNVSGSSAWNDLPQTLRASSTTLGQFQNKLNTLLFCSPMSHDQALS